MLTHLFTFPHSAARYCSFKRILIITLKAFIFKFGSTSMNAPYIFRVYKLPLFTFFTLRSKKEMCKVRITPKSSIIDKFFSSLG